MSNITLNIVEPASPTPTPVDPGTGTVVPNTGLFTSGIGGAEAAIIATIGLVAILAIIGAIIYYRKHKQGKVSNIFAKCKHTIKSKKYASGLAVLALLVSIGTVAGLLKLGASAEEADNIEVQDTTALTVTAESEELTIELGDEPVFAVLPVELTVAEATEAGYTLTAYAENTDLVSATDSSKVIPMVAADEGELVALSDNTYGLSLVEPDPQTDEIYTALSTDQSNPTTIKSMTEYTPTAENDTTTIYYGFYITPDTPYGTYTGSDIYYDATINTTLVAFNGNDLYFNGDTSQTTNEVEYMAVSQEEGEGTINQIISGEYLGPSQSLPYIFLGWSTESTATTPTYISAEDIAQNLPILPNQPVSLYAVWQHATKLSFDGNGADGGEAIDIRTIAAGDTITLPQNTYTREGYTFTGWNTVADGSGRSYDDEADYTAPADSGYVTLYAQWEEDILYMQDVATWGSNLQIGDEITAVDSRDGKEYYVARLADGNIWMTQNLDLCIGCDGVATLDSNNTDLVGTDNNLYNDGYSNNNGVISWIPGRRQPLFIDGGEMYVYPSGSTNEDIVYNSLNECVAGGHPDDLCSHYHVGNFYSWGIANATNTPGGSSNSNNPNSICPAGWKLPSARNQDNDFSNLLYASDIIANRGNTSYTDNGFARLRGEPFYFVRGGRYANSDMVSLAQTGYYWSHDFLYSYDYPSSQREAFFVEFSSSAIYSSGRSTAGTYYYSWSIPVRCTARTY